MIFVALGSNLPHVELGSSRAVVEEALCQINAAVGLSVLRVSPWYETAPWPPSDQPNYVNGVAEIRSESSPEEVMTQLHEIEAHFGRARKRVNEARVLDLDLLTFHDRVARPPAWPLLPHPRMTERAFVLEPLVDLAPEWRHPVLGETARSLLAKLEAGQTATRLED